jgi:flagellar hook protein FlgE
MPSFSIPLSGLTASSDELSAIANNLANLNTVGYKATSTQFSDLLYQNMGANGAGDPIQVGMGTAVSSNESNFTEGPMNPTGVDTDMAINGNGFFVLNDNGQQVYTRAGNFTEGSNGALQSADGASVMGYAANADGTINTNGGIQAIAIDQGQQYPAQATTKVGGGLTLNAYGSDASTYTFPTAQPTGGVTMAGNFSSSATATAFTQTETVYDSTGTAQTLSFNFTPPTAATPNVWGFTVTVPSSAVGTGSPTTVSSGTLTFGAPAGTPPTSSLASVTVNTDPSGGTTYGTVDAAGDVTGISFSGLTDGGTLNLAWNTFTGSTLAQSSAASAVTASQDGHPAAAIPTFSTSIPDVYDAQGEAHTLTLNFWQTGQNQWDYSMTIPGADVGSATSAVQISAGTLGFADNGTLTSVAVTSGAGTGTLTPATSGQTGVGNIDGITIPPLADGAGSLTFNWNLFGNSGLASVSQTETANTATSTSGQTVPNASTGDMQAGDGYASGSLQSIKVDADGTIEGQFSNGQSRAVAQLAIASFADEQGLQLAGANNLQQTLASGDAVIGVAGTAGRGVVAGSELEGSNVDIATEFSNLIVAQQAYQANAKAVTTFNTIAQATLNMQQ